MVSKIISRTLHQEKEETPIIISQNSLVPQLIITNTDILNNTIIKIPFILH